MIFEITATSDYALTDKQRKNLNLEDKSSSEKEMNTLEDLLSFTEEFYEVIISRSSEKGKYKLEIYNDYRE